MKVGVRSTSTPHLYEVYGEGNDAVGDIRWQHDKKAVLTDFRDGSRHDIDPTENLLALRMQLNAHYGG